ncbi:MAG: Asp-tRNA(Asn)/Glu-tRNA(Gln) amidotransferase subunit GatC [Candidatus Riflebacteria bacterium]|nr:Asp-tRNA(Asn)/Glu-tRNA(Gln) amidotransferase subunit GatC [Candidatus Riflebacteria bacterium]
MFDVKKISKLARLNISADEEKTLQGELDQILNYVETLNAVNTDMINIFDVSMNESVFRSDLPTEQSDPGERLKIAPRVNCGQFLVPRVVGEGDA